MKVLIVCNNAFYRGNGLCTAVQTLHKELNAAGIEARIMACANPEEGGPQPEYPLKHFKFPFFEKIIYSSGFRYAAADRKMMREAIGWADVVHLEEGFPIEAIAANLAARAGKVCVGSYHLLTENIMANLEMQNDAVFNRLVTFFWRKLVYDKCRIIHCPTYMVRDYLDGYGFKSEKMVFSNGISTVTDRTSSDKPQADPYLILCTGRFSNEKSQGTLLGAMRHSRHSKEIQLSFAGKGPKEKKYRKMAAQLVKDGVLAYEPVIGFYDSKTLSGISRKAYLYVHCATVEVEGLSCVEALREGAVPVIAKGRVTATAQFALDERSTFPVGDEKVLAERIDWWIEHPEEREKMGDAYAGSVKKYDIDLSTQSMIEMYNKALGK